MAAKSQLIREIDSLPADCLEEILDYICFIKQKRLSLATDTMYVSEKTLARDWNSAEEDAAWADL